MTFLETAQTVAIVGHALAFVLWLIGYFKYRVLSETEMTYAQQKISELTDKIKYLENENYVLKTDLREAYTTEKERNG